MRTQLKISVSLKRATIYRSRKNNLLITGKKELDKLVLLIKENSLLEILLTGHTSSEGASQLNKELSLKRVYACKNYLKEKGIHESKRHWCR